VTRFGVGHGLFSLRRLTRLKRNPVAHSSPIRRITGATRWTPWR
jgi:hypothetical protein